MSVRFEVTGIYRLTSSAATHYPRDTIIAQDVLGDWFVYRYTTMQHNNPWPVKSKGVVVLYRDDWRCLEGQPGSPVYNAVMAAPRIRLR